MARQLTVRNVFDKKHKLFEFEGMWADVLGQPERNGEWLIYGAEKHGKTWFSLALAKYLATKARVTYLSAEEGISVDFKRSLLRAGVSVKDKIKFLPFQETEEIEKLITKRYAPEVLFIDNLTVYDRIITKQYLNDFHKKYNEKLVTIFIAHEERKQPYPSNAAQVSRLARIKIRVEGLQALVAGRCPGGIINIDEQKAQLYHGTKR